MKLAYRTNRGILEMLDILDLNYNKYNICYLKEEIDMASKTKEITKIADSLFHILNNYEI